MKICPSFQKQVHNIHTTILTSHIECTDASLSIIMGVMITQTVIYRLYIVDEGDSHID